MNAQTPVRALLPRPLPTNPLRAPKGTLDRLVVTFRDRHDCVTVASPATDCSATYWFAMGEGCLTYDGKDEDHPADVQVTLSEERSLEELDGIANEWEAAVKARDRAALRRLAGRIKGMAAPPGLTLWVVA